MSLGCMGERICVVLVCGGGVVVAGCVVCGVGGEGGVTGILIVV